MPGARLTFPLVPRRRVIGISFGTMRSLRRGTGTDIAGSRPYRPGDDMDAIDWAASARLSTARGSDEFVVRERFAEEAPRVVVVCDRRPGMACFAAPLLKLRNERLESPDFRAPQDWLERSFEHLAAHRRSVTAGTFVFVLSDFLPPPSKEVWFTAFEYRWDVIPVVIQDPTWEQSFPDVSGIVVPLRDSDTGRAAPVRLRATEVVARRRANEERLARLVGD